MKRQTYIITLHLVANSPDEAISIALNPEKQANNEKKITVYTLEEWEEMFQED